MPVVIAANLQDCKRNKILIWNTNSDMTDVWVNLELKGSRGGIKHCLIVFWHRFQLMELSYALWCVFSADAKEGIEKKQGSDTMQAKIKFWFVNSLYTFSQHRLDRSLKNCSRGVKIQCLSRLMRQWFVSDNAAAILLVIFRILAWAERNYWVEQYIFYLRLEI